MQNINNQPVGACLSRDYALADRDGDDVVIDAAEWDERHQVYRKITLQLSVNEAERLATDLLKAALIVGDEPA